MPELPEVETVCRGIAPHLHGARIVDFVARRADLRSRLPDRLAARVLGRRVAAVRRRAKYILIDLEPAEQSVAETLVVHLGMSGRLIVRDPDGGAPGLHEHVAFATDRGKEIRFSDPRRFGMIDLVATAALDADPRFAALGPEPLSAAFSPAPWRPRWPGGAPRSRRPSSISAASPESATSMPARLCSRQESPRAGRPAASAAPGSLGWSRP